MPPPSRLLLSTTSLFHLPIRLSLSCYSRSSSLPGGSDNPDLYFNRGTLWKYLEEFERAKDDFERCEVIDQGLEGGRNAREVSGEALLDYDWC